MLGLLISLGQPVWATTVRGTVMIDGQASEDAVVYLERTAGTPPSETTPGHVVMDQRNLEFVPRVLPVMRGTTVEFINSDDIQHNVFSPTDAADKFDLGTYGPGAARSVKLDEAGEVLILCNIHMEMEARIVVLPEPYFARADAGGAYEISAVPPGTYTAKIWQGRFRPDIRTVDVPASGEVTLDWRLDR